MKECLKNKQNFPIFLFCFQKTKFWLEKLFFEKDYHIGRILRPIGKE